MRYSIILKSHTDMPDYEDECEAESREAAAKHFLSKLAKYGWEYQEVFDKTQAL